MIVKCQVRLAIMRKQMYTSADTLAICLISRKCERHEERAMGHHGRQCGRQTQNNYVRVYLRLSEWVVVLCSCPSILSPISLLRRVGFCGSCWFRLSESDHVAFSATRRS